MSSLFSPMTGKRECRVSSTSGMNAGRLVVERDDVHLRARDHDVAHRHLGHLQHALDHRQRVGVEQLALERAVQQREQFLAVLGLAGQERGEPLEQRRLVVLVVGFDTWQGRRKETGVCGGSARGVRARGVARRAAVRRRRRDRERPRPASIAVSRASITPAARAVAWSNPCRCSMPWTTRWAQWSASALPCSRASRRTPARTARDRRRSGRPSSYTKVSTLVA